VNPERSRTRHIADGVVHVYRLFDVGQEVDLARVEELLAAPRSRVALESEQGTTAFEIPRPPVRVTLGSRTLRLRSGTREATAVAQVFDYGAVSILYKLPIQPGTPLGALVPLAEDLAGRPTPELDAEARREALELARAIAPAIDRPHSWDGLETYLVFLVRRFEQEVTAAELLEEAPLAELLLGETSPVRLSDGEREDVLKHAFSYLEDDLAVVDWNCAFLLEPSGVNDIPDLLELATAHLLELRYYDALLDRELKSIYQEVGKGRRLSGVFTRRHLRLQRRTAALLLELSEMIERVDNAVKIIGDFYLARLYQGAVRRFRLPAWEESVLRKQRLLAEVNGLLNDAADRRRGELLEMTVILLILWEILYALLRH
jgi:hypothetical protein